MGFKDRPLTTADLQNGGILASVRDPGGGSGASDLSELTDTTGILTAKVDKVTGKALSTNDFTTTLKNKLDDIEAGATAVADLSDITDTTGIIPADLSELTDTTNLIPADISELTDTTGIIPADVSDLTDTTNLLAPTTLDLGTALTVNGTFKGITMTGTVDTNAVGVGALLAIGTDGNFDEADADVIANCYMLAMATATGTGSKTLLLQGLICNTAWNFNIGLPIYASITQGTLSQSIVSGTDDVNVMIGFALSATCIYFNPYLAYVTKT